MQVLLLALLLVLPLTVQAEYLGNLSANEFDANSTANPFGAGSPFSSDSVTNEFGRYGNPYSKQSATNPYATDAPRLYDQQGAYRGKLSTNQFDPDSTPDNNAEGEDDHVGVAVQPVLPECRHDRYLDCGHSGKRCECYAASHRQRRDRRSVYLGS